MAHNEDDLAEESLQHALMNEMRDYLSRGRTLEQTGDAELQELWVMTFKRVFAGESAQQRRVMDDAAAELRLRNLELPHDRVADLLKKMRSELNRIGPDAPPESLDRANEEFLEARSKPKN